MSDTKITPAMKEWCRKLANPERCTLVSTGRLNYHCRGWGSVHKPTYVLVGKLEDAGLITWSSPIAHDERTAILTDAGKHASGVPGRVEGKPCNS